MTRAEIRRRLEKQLREIKPGLKDLLDETRLEAMDLDSTDIAFWLSDAEAEFDITLDDTDLAALRDATLRDLVDMIERALQDRPQ